jgi:hypothetical protein
MPKSKRTYRYRELHSCAGTFEIESWSTKDKYFVDIWDKEGNGSCSCKDFNTRCLPNWKDNGHQIVDYGTTGRPNPKRTQCRHLKFLCWANANKVRAECYKLHRMCKQ